MGPDGKLQAAPVAFSAIRADSGVVVPASCGALLWRLGDALGLSVVVKSTFSLETSPMRSTSAELIHCVDVMHPTAGAVVAPNDLVPRKSKVDVVAWGRALAPGVASGQVKVRLAVSQVAHNAIDRSFQRSVGDASGFGPFGFNSPMRRAMLKGAPLSQGGDGALVIPASVTPEFFQSAPPAQQMDALARDATITLEGMHASRASITAQLPSVMAEGVAFGLTKRDARAPLAFRADTVVIDTDRMTCSVVWRAELGLVAAAQLPSLLVAAGVSTADHRLTLPSTRPGAAPTSTTGRNMDATVMFGDASPSGAANAPAESPFAGTVEVSAGAAEDLPFREGSGHAPAALAWAEKVGDAANKGGTAMVSSGSLKGAPLPFGKKAKPAGPSGEAKVPSSKASRMVAWAKAIEGGADRTEDGKPRSTGSDTLPFAKSGGGKTPPKPAAESWVEAIGNARGGTAVVFGKEREGSTLPFGDDLQTQREAALAEAEAKRTAEEARLAELEAQKRREEAEVAAKEEAAARERELADKRREEEKKRFEEEQQRLREQEAERKRDARAKAAQDAAELEDDLYGGFGPKT